MKFGRIDTIYHRDVAVHAAIGHVERRHANKQRLFVKASKIDII